MLAGLVRNATWGWWWAERLAALVIAGLAGHEELEAFGDGGGPTAVTSSMANPTPRTLEPMGGS